MEYVEVKGDEAELSLSPVYHTISDRLHMLLSYLFL
jgi:hypothetical protein